VKLSLYRLAPFGVHLALGLVFVFFSMGYDSPDEHYPTLEAASRLLFGHWTETWEWGAGLRSWIQPLWIWLMLKPWVDWGLTDRVVLDAIARLGNLALSLGGLWAVGRLAGPRFSLATRWIYATSVPLLVWGLRHGSDTFSTPLLLMGFALLFRNRQISTVLAGFLLSLTILARFPLVPIVLVYGFLLFASRRLQLELISLKSLLAGAALGTGLGMMIDAHFYSKVFNSSPLPIYEFFKFNVLAGSGRFHASHAFDFTLYAFLLGLPPFTVLLFARKARSSLFSAELLTVVLICLVYAVFIRHHELRFALPLVPFMLLATAQRLPERLTLKIAATQLLLLPLALALYSKPHGAIVKSLNLASGALSSTDPEGPLFLAEVTGAIPRYYMQTNGPLVHLSPQNWGSLCAGQISEIEPEKRIHFDRGKHSSAVVISVTPCSRCEQLASIQLDLGHRLRATISPLPPRPRYVSRCKL
jgi:hypothetical protein